MKTTAWKGLKIMRPAIKRIIKKTLYSLPVVKNYIYGLQLDRRYDRDGGIKDKLIFVSRHHKKLYLERVHHSKASQISRLLQKIDIEPVENSSFFYSIDCYKSIAMQGYVYDNCTVDYAKTVCSSLANQRELFAASENSFSKEEPMVIDALYGYLERCKQDTAVMAKYKKQIEAIDSLFHRPAESLFEGLQRILFYNQFLWQTGHMLVGLGRLDVILGEVYQHDIGTGRLSRDSAKKLIADFFHALHEYYQYKSAALVGDTGQIIILGGRMMNGGYFRNDLTDLFIEVSEELKLPDPKILLRCTADMPEDLLEKAVCCIATGIGAPLLSNDDTVISALVSDGYAEEDAYPYCTSACWEPLLPGISCDQNNIATLNFAVPLVQTFEDAAFEQMVSFDDVLRLYKIKLMEYIGEILLPLSKLQFEKDPLLSLVSPSAIVHGKDFTRGGAKYNNLGLTSVGLGTVVNSLMNLQKIVFEDKSFTLKALNDLRQQNFANNDALLQKMKNVKPCYGYNEEQVLALTREIIDIASKEFSRYHTSLGGHFKFGLSAPSYISGAKNVRATFDGRRDGEPFGVHISANIPLAPTELLSFAAQLDYAGNRLNGNVIDFFVTPGALRQNLQKYCSMLLAGFRSGIFQLQMNVVESKTLIAAKAHPEQFPQLVVRVWGFSAYFNDLPEEYKDILIARAIESEKVA